MKKYVAVLIIMTLIVTIPLEIYAMSNEIRINWENQNIENQINELFDKRAELINKGEYEKIEKVESQLELLGVSKMEPTEVLARFSGDVETLSTNEVEAINSHAVIWFTDTREYTFDGNVYIIETMTAQPSQGDSCLKSYGGYLEEDVVIGEAITMAFISTAVSTISSGLIERLEDGSKFLTIYDFLKNLVEGLSPITIVEHANTSYTYANSVTVTFKFVNDKGMSDMTKILATRGTRCVTSVGGTTSFYTYDEKGVAHPGTEVNEELIVSFSDGYNSNMNAIRVFLGQEGISIDEFVYSINIGTLEEKPWLDIYPVRPWTPLEVY